MWDSTQMWDTISYHRLTCSKSFSEILVDILSFKAAFTDTHLPNFLQVMVDRQRRRDVGALYTSVPADRHGSALQHLVEPRL